MTYFLIGSIDNRKVGMQIPENLESLINFLLMNIQSDPHHNFSAQKRQEIYEAFGPRTDHQAARARGWLAVITARHVLSIFEQALPDENHPRKLIEMAEATLRGKFSVEEAIREAAEGHEISGRLWGHEETEVTWNAYLAGTAAHRALAEAAGVDPFMRISWIRASDSPDQGGQPIPFDQLPDEKLAEWLGDTAAAAAVAHAYDSDQLKSDPQKLLEFWRWWLKDAITAAWNCMEANDDC
ncbi:Imm5 family immunity protein [Longilinea arvoryzae]|nr:Imm5 family immunity protein [Longilinea arvoryzae]